MFREKRDFGINQLCLLFPAGYSWAVPGRVVIPFPSDFIPMQLFFPRNIEGVKNHKAGT